MKDIAIYGAGGFGREVACLLRHINGKAPVWNLIGFFDDGKQPGSETGYGKIWGGRQELNTYAGELSIVCAIGNPGMLKKVISGITNPRIQFPNIIAPDVVFHDYESVRWGKGNVVFFHSLVSCNVCFGDFNLLNNDVFMGHDARIGNYNVFNPSVRISGNVEIGEANFLGVSAVVLQQIKIGNDTVIGANSVVLRKTKDGNTYVGNPAMIVKY